MSSAFAYLFERFPSFTQTFCFREVIEMRRQGVVASVYSIRTPAGEPEQDFPAELDGVTTYLPQSFDDLLAADAGFRRSARKALADMRKIWGGESEKRRIYEALWLLPRLRERGIGHVHTHFAGTAARTAFWLNRLGGIHYSITAHANDVFCDEPPERLKGMFSCATSVVTVSNFSAELLRKSFPQHAEKIRRVYNGVDIEKFTSGTPRNARPLIVAVGRYIEKKGFGNLIAACAKLRDIDFECRIIGDGPLGDSLRRQVAESNLADRVFVTGPKPEWEIIEALASAMVFALPCVVDGDGGKDNLPTVIMEAMAAGLPVVSTRLAGVPEMVEDGVTGVLVEPGDREALEAALRSILENPSWASKMGEAGRERCRALFASEATTKALRGILSEDGAFDSPRKSIVHQLFQR